MPKQANKRCRVQDLKTWAFGSNPNSRTINLHIYDLAWVFTELDQAWAGLETIGNSRTGWAHVGQNHCRQCVEKEDIAARYLGSVVDSEALDSPNQA